MRVAGVVQRVEAGLAWVEVESAGGCGRCHEPGGCGGVNIVRPLDGKAKVFRLPNDVGAAPGDRVGVVIEDGLALKAAMLAYGLPVLSVLAGAAMGTALSVPGREDLGAVLGVLCGAGLAYLFGRGRWQGRVSPVRLVREFDPEGGKGCGA